ncbi:glycosyltransferase family 2 protein [Rhodohalobacter mucosus]|uniref:Glycosyltransferase family 2 protein n=1 Tax=Rhodohalobacter mucosus TaxID=2079485 RepID=A0A316TV92_9BACT|nr:glycosyltransferase family 2 protein [Rhodohalobacter mucosus]PWN07818.1 glycosyltransferase family 2 protein [Rhodohalobacter mucosus]
MEKADRTVEEPFVSVLTPVYNGETYLRECIESVLAQSYSNWEYVLVNNQSTDRSLEIMEEYAERDSRIRIHNNEEFLPQMENFNHSFHQISPDSKYCKVVHADDMLFPDCISKMVALNEKYPTVGIVGAYRLDDRRVGLDGLPYPSHCISGEEICRSYFLDNTFYFGAPTSLLLRCDLIREREKVYVESHQGTDTGACIELLKNSDFGFVHQVLTFTRRHENSQTSTACQTDFTWIHAKLFNTLEYGPYYLNEVEYQKCLKADFHRFYSMLAANLFENRSVERFKRQLQVLDDLNLSFNTSTFLKYVLRGAILHLFKIMNVELRKTSGQNRPVFRGNRMKTAGQLKNPRSVIEKSYDPQLN